MIKSITTIRWWVGIVLVSSLFVFSCREDEIPDPGTPPDVEEPDDEPNPAIAINNWIYDVMDEVYYWTSTMNPAIAADSDPEAFFNALLVEEDRFSIIYPNYEELVDLLSGVQKEAGYHYTLFRESESNNKVFGMVLYVKKGSPAEAAGIKRNDRFTEINGFPITVENYRSLTSNLGENHNLTISRFDEAANSGAGAFVTLSSPVSLNVVELTENPVFLDSVYTVGNRKIGYLIYNFFAPGTELASETGIAYGAYDQQLDQIIASFKGEGVNELILDLRYNGGGYVTSAIHLASLLGKGVTENSVFYKTQYNQLYQDYFTQERGEDFFTSYFVNKTGNIGSQLASGKLYIITSRGTASASELIINGLRPYMEVELIGETTYGKNVGSITIQDTQNEENHYGLLPIVTKSFNSLNQSDYTNGFNPTIQAVEQQNNGFLYPLGDIRETLLDITLDYITTGQVPTSSRHAVFEKEALYNDLEGHVRFGRMIEQRPGTNK